MKPTRVTPLNVMQRLARALMPMVMAEAVPPPPGELSIEEVMRACPPAAFRYISDSGWQLRATLRRHVGSKTMP